MKIKRIQREARRLNYAPAVAIILAVVLSFSADGDERKRTLNTDSELEKCESPYLMVNSDSPDSDRIPLKHTEATVNVSGVIANVKVEQVYVNEGESVIEAIYVFPGSTQAAVHGMTMQIGERRIEAKINEKEQARKAYEQAKSDGKTASLLEQQRPNVFQMNVANILPGDTLKVELRYTELLVPTDGVYNFVYPTVVGPRYQGDPGLALASAGESWVSNPYQKEGDAPLYTLKISGTINAGMPIKQAVCNTHSLNIKFNGPNKAVFSSGTDELAGGNKDVILKYQLRGNKVESGVLLFEGEKENFFLAMMEPPKQVKPEQIPPREYIFVVDVSGSMNGFPLTVSKKLMEELLSDLRPVDRFNVLLFASGNSVLAKQSLPATQDNINKAIRLIDNQHGSGGTEMLPALKEALAMPHEEGISRTMIIATDGYISFDREAIDLIRNNLGEANFFAFGIGSSVNRYLIEGMAHAGKGEPFVLTSESDAKKGAKKFRTYIESPVLTDIKIELSGIQAYDVEPMNVPDVFAERPVIIFGKYKGSAYGKLKITGTSGEGKYAKEMPIELVFASADNEALKYLWARKRIQLLDDFAQFGRTDETKKEVTDLGLKYNLLTQYTSFVAIDSEVRNKDGKQTTVVQPLPLPEGVSDKAVANGSYSWSMGAAGNSGYATSQPAAGEFAKREEKSSRNEFELQRKLKEAEYAVEEYDVVADLDSFNASSIIYESPEKKAEFNGGQAALEAYIRKQLGLTEAEAAKWKGLSVKVSFVVNADGSLSDIRVIGTSDKELIDRVTKLFEKMPVWKAGEMSGKKVNTRVIVPIKIG